MSLETIGIMIAIILMLVIITAIMTLVNSIHLVLYVNNKNKLDKAESDIIFFKSQMEYFINENKRKDEKVKELKNQNEYLKVNVPRETKTDKM